MKSRYLNEFSVGSADSVAERVFGILSKRTGIKFKTQKTLIPYKNRWGSFLGKFASSSDGKCFRLNFARGKSDEVVSMEYWGKGKNPYKVQPDKIFSFEGWGITKIFFQVEAFVKGNFKIEEASAIKEELFEARLQEETVKEAFAMYAADNPAVIANIAKGSFDEADMFQKLKTYIGIKKIKVAGLAKHTLAATIKSYLKKVAKGEEPAAGISTAQAAQAANAVPCGMILPGSAGGVNTIEMNLYDVLDKNLASKVNNLLAEVNSEKGAFGIIKNFEKQLKVAVARNTGARLVVACGRAGTGKTYTVKKFLQYGEDMGLSPGSGYVEVQGIKFDSEDDVAALFCKYKDVPILLFDDADQLFISRSIGVQNIMKHVLDPDRSNRTLTIEKDTSTKVGKTLAGEYTIDCKLVWCTNLGPGNLTPAVADRMDKPANVFNFTDQEILDLIKAKLNDVYDEFPGLTQDEVFMVFMIIQSAANKLAQKPGYDVMSNPAISFRNFKNTLAKMETLKLINLPMGEALQELANSLGVKIESPAKVMANA